MQLYLLLPITLSQPRFPFSSDKLMSFLFHNFHVNLYEWRRQSLHFTKANLMYEIHLHKTRFGLETICNVCSMTFDLETFRSYLRNSYSIEPISTTILKIHHQNKEIYQHNISGTAKSSDRKRF